MWRVLSRARSTVAAGSLPVRATAHAAAELQRRRLPASQQAASPSDAGEAGATPGRPLAMRTRFRRLLESGELRAAAGLLNTLSSSAEAPSTEEPAARERSELESQLLQACLRLRSVDDLALTLLDAQAARGALNRDVCRSALKVCGRSGAWREALALLRHLPAAERSAADYADAIAACGAGAQVEQMWQLAGEALAEAGPLDAATTVAMMRGCRRGEDMQGCERLWRRLCDDSGGLDREPPPAEALEVYLRFCADVKQWQRAEALLGEAAQAGLDATRAHWNTALTACVRAGALDEGERLLRAMPHAPSTINYNTLLHGYAQLWAAPGSNRAERAAALCDEMRAQGVRFDEVTYNALLDLHRFDVTQVQVLLEQMRADEVRAARHTRSATAAHTRTPNTPPVTAPSRVDSRRRPPHHPHPRIPASPR